MKKHIKGISDEWHNSAQTLNTILKINARRVYNLVLIVAGFELFMILAHIFPIGYLWGEYSKLYFGLYISLFTLCCIIAVILRRVNRMESFTDKQRDSINTMLDWWGLLLVLWGAFISLIDQLNGYGQIIAFVINFVVVGTVFILDPLRMFRLTVAPLAVLCVGLAFMQKEQSVLLGDYVNLAVLFVCVAVGNYFAYSTFCQSEYYKNRAIEISLIDELTGISNRRGLHKYVDENFTDSGDNTTAVGILMLDVDFFKKYNDFYGHPAGDKVLIAIGKILKSVADEYDAAVCRYGGEEFVLFIKDKTREEVNEISRSILESMRKLHIDFSETDVKGQDEKVVSVSIGQHYTHVSRRDEAWDGIVFADRALYKAKSSGRNRIEIWE